MLNEAKEDVIALVYLVSIKVSPQIFRVFESLWLFLKAAVGTHAAAVDGKPVREHMRRQPR